MRKVGRGCVERGFEGFDSIACGRLASNQLVHASGGKPDFFSKDGAQVGGAINFVCAALSKVTSNSRCLLLTGGMHLMSQRLVILSLG